jgi:hypothetical protein
VESSSIYGLFPAFFTYPCPTGDDPYKTNHSLSSFINTETHQRRRPTVTTMKPPCVYLLIILLVLPLLASAAGVWEPIKNVNDPHVKEIGEFAVAEYDKSSKADLKFMSVVKGETQVVAGTNYRLVLEAKDGAATKHYEAVVWEKPWQNLRNLTSFKNIN